MRISTERQTVSVSSRTGWVPVTIGAVCIPDCRRSIPQKRCALHLTWRERIPLRSRQTRHLPVVAAAEVLVKLVVDRLLEESDRAIREGKVRSTRVTRLEPRAHAVRVVP